MRHRFVFLLVLLFPFTVPLSAQTVSCSSDDGEKHYCEADTRYGAHLLRQTSTAECAEGKTWGWDEEGVWVNKGCAGQFTLGKTEPALEPAPEKHPPCNVANSCVLIKEEIKRSCALVAKDAPKFCEEYK